MLQRTTPSTTANVPIEVPRKSYQVHSILSHQNSSNSIDLAAESEGSILVAIYNNTNARHTNSTPTHNTEQSLEMGNTWMQPKTSENIDKEISIVRRTTIAGSSTNKVSNTPTTPEGVHINRQRSYQENRTTFSSPSFNTDHIRALQSPTQSTSENEQNHNFSSSLNNFKDWSRLYLFGHKHDIEMPRITKPS